ncbi:MAG: gliding motility-associated C-terminal domain-containing protein [Flavobacteriales bacterium]|nr:gliding motility-associated C-terminal domain-containing protein [Flavobacteriales bacterium]
MAAAACAQCPTTISTFPYQEGFEATAAWTSGGSGNDWAWGTPAKPVINSAGGGSKCWIVGGLTTSSYSPGEQSWLMGPCFDFSALPFPIVSFKFFWECERTYDGAGFQYSLDQGATWSNVGTVNEPPDCYTQNWFNASGILNLNQASPNAGWSGRVGPTVGSCQGGQGSGAWVTASHCLAFLGGEPSVKFRFVFGAGTTCNAYDGVAVDDINIGAAPPEPNPVQWTCFADTIAITGLQTCADAWDWNFGDPASGAANTSTAQTPQHVFSAPGVYNVTLTLSYSCRSPQIVPIAVNILGLQVLTTDPTCAGNDGSVEAIITGASGPLTYQWNPGGYTTSMVNGLGAGSYVLLANDGGTCPTGAMVTLSPPPSSPSASASSTPVSCNGFADGSATVVANGGTPGYTYAWSPSGGNNATANNLAAGNYTCTITDGSNCATVVSVMVTEPMAIVLTAQDDIALCLGDATTLTATTVGGTGTIIYAWSPAGPDVQPQSTSTFSVAATDDNGCTSAIEDVTVTIGSVATPTFIVGDTLGCSPHCASFAADNASDQLVWDFGDGTTAADLGEVRHCYAAGGVYDVTLTATSASGCSGSWTYAEAVDVIQSPIAAFIAVPPVSTMEQPTIHFVDESSGADSLQWSFGVLDSASTERAPSFTYDSVACYTVSLRVASVEGCASTISGEVCIEDPYALYVPNAFTPNDDGFNDSFFPVTSVRDPKDFQLLIYDRWGQVLFTSASPSQAWDGGGTPIGVYVWKLWIRDTLGKQHESMGHVSLVR